MTAIHHPSCPIRQHQHTVTCPVHTVTSRPEQGPWTELRTVEFSGDCLALVACLCGPAAEEEDQLILQLRTPDEAVLDVFTHVAQAMTDFQTNARRRGAPKGPAGLCPAGQRPGA